MASKKIFLLLACELGFAWSDLPQPTGYGTVVCKKWPILKLQDYNPNSQDSYMNSYWLDDISSSQNADVTVVGLYFADSEDCQEAAALQEQLGFEIEAEYGNITVQNIALNYYAPYSCAMVSYDKTRHFL